MHNSKQLHTARNAHLIGIGGIGLSALARWLLALGKNVSGCDAIASKITRALIKESISVDFGHNPEHIRKFKPDIIIASPAVPEDNPEILEAKKMGVPVLNYPEALGLLSNSLVTTAICGTNGKSTTTALVGLALIKGGIDPTILVGSIVKEISGNFRKGDSNVAVIEACEYKRAFHHYTPQNIIITNIEAEHLDYFKSLEDIVSAFEEFALQIKPDGIIIANGDDLNVKKVLDNVAAKRPDIKIIRFGKGNGCDIKFSNVKVKKEKTYFDIVSFENEAKTFCLQIPGEFNVYNAAAVLTAAKVYDVSFEKSSDVLSDFGGIWRRFERVGEYRGALIISDYAHHPTAVEKTIQAARSIFPKRRIVAVFQPHQHNRTRMFFDDFVKCFDEADVIILLEIYKVLGRISEEDKKISSNDLVSAMKDRDGEKGVSREILFALDLHEAEFLVKKHTQKNDCVLIMGAGDIGELPERIVLKK